jgi:hypothetical protein
MTDVKASSINKVLNTGGSDIYFVTQSASTVGISASAMLNGWINDPIPWTAFASGSGFTRANGNQVFGMGVRLKFTQGGITRYAYSGSTAGTGGSVVYTHSGAEPIWAGSTITNQQYSYAHPVDFTDWFNWNPVFTGFSINPVGIHRFCIDGRKAMINVYQTSGSSNGTLFVISLPVPIQGAVAETTSARIINAGSIVSTPGLAVLSGSNLNIYIDNAGNAFSSSWAKFTQGVNATYET